MSIARIHRTLRVVQSDERGVALPTVLIFMLAGVLLSLVVSSTVLFAYTFSSTTRASVQSQASAEAGIAAARAGLLNGTCTASNGLYTGTDPVYSVQVYKPSASGGWTAGCPAISEDARIVATGTAASKGVNGDASGDISNVEAILGSLGAEVELAATGPAIFAYASSGAGGGGKLVSLDGTNVDVMLHTGNVTCDGGFSGAANVVVKSGGFSAVGGCNLAGNVWVNGNVTISGGANIGGSVTGAAVNISNGTVGGNMWADGVLTSGGGSVAGWATGQSLTMTGGSLGATWTRSGNATISGGTIRGTLTVNGNATMTNGSFNAGVGVVATGSVTTGISIPGGVVNGGNVTVTNGTTTGVTSRGVLKPEGGNVNGTVKAMGLTMIGPGWATLAGAQIAGPGCFTGTGAISAAVKITSLTVGGANSCKNQAALGSWYTGNGPITVGTVTAPASPVLTASPLKPAAIIVPNWVDFGSKAEHYSAAGWPGYTVVPISGTCNANKIWTALNTIGTSKGLIDARACSGGISLTGSSNEYTGPFGWGDDLTRNGFTLKNDLVIIANQFALSGSARFTGAGTESQLWLINPDTVANSTPDCAGGEKLEITGGATFPKLRTMIYSPCKIVIGSSTSLKGQVFAGETQIAGGATITYAPLGLPGYDLGTGDETAVAATEWDRPIVSQRNITG